MLRRIDYLYHFTKDINVLFEIFRYRFKTSFTRETLADKNVIVPMISFSNILLRDVGTDEVLNYGDYALCLSREWGIANDINPVVYTYEKGLLNKALSTFLFNSLFLSRIQQFKPKLKELSDCKCGPFSKLVSLTNTPKEVMAILDHLSMEYDDNLVDILSNLARTIYDTNMRILTLTKQYKVANAQGKEFIAYNDREWRKLYSDLPIYFEGDNAYEHWTKTNKPHFSDKDHVLTYKIEDIKAVLVKDKPEIDEVINVLKHVFGDNAVDTQLANGSLLIGTKDTLEENNF
jgi:hypothetical protein